MGRTISKMGHNYIENGTNYIENGTQLYRKWEKLGVYFVIILKMGQTISKMGIIYSHFYYICA
jgi:hypothetical protein